MAQVYGLITSEEAGVSYSPFVIWAELFLLHKNIEFTTVPLTYAKVGPTIKEVTDGKWSKVPTIKFDNGDIKYDSIPICDYLDEKYPDNPIRRAGSKAEAALFAFSQDCSPGPFKLVVLDIISNVDEASKDCVRKDKEAEYGMTIEELVSSENENEVYAKFYKSLAILYPLLENSEFFEGEEVGFSDYALAGLFQFVRSINPSVYKKLIHDSPYPKISEWATRMDDLFGGYLKNRKTC